MKRAFVTGCAGFIGSHLTERLLNEGFEVIGSDRFSDYYPQYVKEQNLTRCMDNPFFTLIDADICEMKSFPDVDLVFHLAAQPGVQASWGDEFHTYIRDNIEATQHLLEWYKDKPIQKLV